MSRKSADISTVAFVSLGCPKNLVDSEKMLGLLAEDGLIPISGDQADDTGADAIVINTCGFLEESKEESLGEIERAIELKQQGLVKRVIVAGCLVQRHRAKLLDWCPGIDALIGVFDRDRIVQAVRPPRKGEKPQRSSKVELPVYSSIAANATLARQERGIEAQGYFEDDSARLRLTPRHYTYLRISEGCNQNCAFCTIPSIRGKMRSKPPQAIVRELQELLADGAFEINLIGQDTTSYGSDIGYEPGLVGLLETLNETIQPFRGWLRLMYAYPSCFTDEMIDAIARLPHVLKYIDMPLQHINDRVLDSMRRRTSRRQIETLLTKLRDHVPGVAIRTTFISGYPGETDAEHNELVEFVRDFNFEAMGVFAYSPEPGTPAGSLHENGQAITDGVVEQRIDELMLTQQQLVFARNEQLVQDNHECDVLIDAINYAEPDSVSPDRVHSARLSYVARTCRQAPEIDGRTHVLSSQPLSPGELLRCRIVGSNGYDLIARPIEQADGRVRLTVVR
ncbi:MAG: 30S ribosomal protein S12 methylthiotransferase RimO [Phycisphaeraceae bacterium]|nr:30S ribosomal protein S12 methylthiotransferase RimO [Phycisphaeraceae bacterium]